MKPKEYYLTWILRRFPAVFMVIMTYFNFYIAITYPIKYQSSKYVLIPLYGLGMFVLTIIQMEIWRRLELAENMTKEL